MKRYSHIGTSIAVGLGSMTLAMWTSFAPASASAEATIADFGLERVPPGYGVPIPIYRQGSAEIVIFMPHGRAPGVGQSTFVLTRVDRSASRTEKSSNANIRALTSRFALASRFVCQSARGYDQTQTVSKIFVCKEKPSYAKNVIQHVSYVAALETKQSVFIIAGSATAFGPLKALPAGVTRAKYAAVSGPPDRYFDKTTFAILVDAIDSFCKTHGGKLRPATPQPSATQAPTFAF
jgi:hypothetical protein